MKMPILLFVTYTALKMYRLDLPVADLSSSEGKLMLPMFSAFAEFERHWIRDRTKEGIERAQGKKLGRPADHATTKSVQEKKAGDCLN